MTTRGLKDLKIKLFQDGADLNQMVEAYKKGVVKGFTTNPTLMRKAGVTDYAAFAKAAIKAIPDRNISFEVFSDDLAGMEREARVIASWGGDTSVKVPISNTKGESTVPLIRKLSSEGFSLNVTAILTLDQVKTLAPALNPKAKSIVSVFAGRIADTGVDPVPLMSAAAAALASNANADLLWASPRELLNVFHAEDCGCRIITATPDILAKLGLIGKDLTQYSLETVKMFYADATAAGFKI
ncbi:MAG: transaldolase [Alphaproteobacteria bacterium]|nr:transaldolase [Alphaproteobacteria bacterium]